MIDGMNNASIFDTAQYFNIDLCCFFTFENTGQHSDTLFGEGQCTITIAAAF